jgi:formiminoglutamase
LQDIDLLYVTVCLDAFPASAAPGVSAPSALGVDPLLVIRVLRYLAEKQQAMQYQWQLCDIAEMNPQFDIDSRTAKLAARLIFEVTDALV